MTKTKYRTSVAGKCPVKFRMWTSSKEESISQARILQDNYGVVVCVSEVVSDGEDIVSNKIVFDGSDD